MKASEVLATVLARRSASRWLVESTVKPESFTYCASAVVCDDRGRKVRIEVEQQQDRGFRVGSVTFRVKAQPNNLTSLSEGISYIRWTEKTDSAKLDEFWASKVPAAADYYDIVTRGIERADAAAKKMHDATGYTGESSNCILSTGYWSKFHDGRILNIRVEISALTEQQAIAILNAAKSAGVRI